VQDTLDANPALAYAYAESLTLTGDRATGIERLRNLERDSPALGTLPLAIGRALAADGNFVEAEPELRKAVQLQPSNPEPKYQLATALFSLKKDAEAQALLAQLTGVAGPETSQDADVFHRIGKLQLAHGMAKLAVANIETAARLSPDSPGISEDLIAAYVEDQRPADAQREQEHLGKLKARANQGSPTMTGK
jgi:Flp pilus assembly protein TadD